MAHKRIVFNNPETGHLSIIYPVYNDRLRPDDATDDDVLDECIRRNIETGILPAGVAYRVVESSEIPTHRLFRNAWSDDGNNVDVDMSDARDIHMDDIRVDRDKKLTELDVTFMRAIEDDDSDAQDVASVEKQALRDIPETFDLSSASTPEQLTALWPEDLDRSDN
jgi:hypothetical protein